MDQTNFADDLLRGAAAIGKFMGQTPRWVYHLTEHSNIPVFKLGSMICALKSTLRDWIREQEDRNRGKPPNKPKK